MDNAMVQDREKQARKTLRISVSPTLSDRGRWLDINNRNAGYVS